MICLNDRRSLIAFQTNARIKICKFFPSLCKVFEFEFSIFNYSIFCLKNFKLKRALASVHTAEKEFLINLVAQGLSLSLSRIDFRWLQAERPRVPWKQPAKRISLLVQRCVGHCPMDNFFNILILIWIRILLGHEKKTTKNSEAVDLCTGEFLAPY